MPWILPDGGSRVLAGSNQALAPTPPPSKGRRSALSQDLGVDRSWVGRFLGGGWGPETHKMKARVAKTISQPARGLLGLVGGIRDRADLCLCVKEKWAMCQPVPLPKRAQRL